MAHDHQHGHSHSHSHSHMPSFLTNLKPTTRLILVIIITGSFFCVELSLGFYTRSLALIADAFHYLNDLVSFIVALVAIKITERKNSPKGFSFGWQRAQLLGAFFNGVFLAALGLSIFLQSLERFIRIETIEKPLYILIVGGVGLALNILSVAFLHDHSHGGAAPAAIEASADQLKPDSVHAEHRHIINAASQASKRDLNMLGVLIHIAGDAMNNIGVMAAALAIMLSKSPARYYADPAISLAISFMIFATSLPLIKRSGAALLQSSPVGIDMADVKFDLEKLPGVSSVHELHIWSLSQTKRVASVHVVTKEGSLTGWLKRAREIGECLHAYGVHSYTLQPELCSSVTSTAGTRSIAESETTRAAGTEIGESSGPRVEQLDGLQVSRPQSCSGSQREMELGELRRREGRCQVQCEAEECKELQCCD